MQSLFLISKPFSKFFLQNFFILKWAVAGRAIFPRGFLSSLLCMERHLSAAQKLPVLPVSVRHLSAAQKVQPAAINGLGESSLTGAKLVVKPTRQSIRTKNIRSGAMVAKYGDKSVYFDLEDLGNTTGKWDLYGSDAMMIHMLVNILVNIQELKGPEFAAAFSVSEDRLRKFIDAQHEAVILPMAQAAPPYKEERKPPKEEEEERKQQPPEEGERRGDAGKGEGRREDDRGDKGSIGNDMVMRFD